MTHPDQPLTARVWVNRLWQWHFGKGLVETSNDFGTQGTRPTHPQLLDYLASELIDHDWDTRRIHRLIVDSSTYRQSSDHHAANAARDPDNRLWWRWTPRRLDAETIRDSVLAVSGHLERRTGGPSVEPHAPRRSLYLRQKRDHLPPQTILFDGPDGLTSCPRRRTSTNALQPLWSLNSDFMQSAARRLAERTGDVENAVRRTLHRRPTASERQQLEALTRQHGLASACLALLNSSEFMYLP
jgi:hypothetical protein